MSHQLQYLCVSRLATLATRTSKLANLLSPPPPTHTFSLSTLRLPDTPASQLYLVWVYAIHIYHPIFFKTNVMDWIHHIPVYILNTLMFSTLSGPVFQLHAMILTGVPGGIEYFLLVLEGEGWVV